MEQSAAEHERFQILVGVARHEPPG
jgi:hypothetical protein